MRARSIASLAMLLGVVAAQGCGGDFDPGSRVTSLRVIAVSADARWGSADPNDATNFHGESYAKPGDDVWLEAEWYVPRPDEPYSATPDLRPREWLWLRCIDPDDTSVVGCIKAIGEEVKETGDVTKAFLNVPTPGNDLDVVKVTIPSDALSRLPEDARTNATVGVVLLVCPGKLNLTNGVDFTSISTGQIPLECDDATPDANGNHPALPLDQWVVGIKRIFVRESETNANPAFASITWDGDDWKDTDPPKPIKPCDDDGNRYDRCTTDQHQIGVKLADSGEQEQVVVEFYSTEGTFEHEVRIAASATTGFAARKQSKDGLLPIKIWIVAHDNRGGVVWAERTVQPVP